MDIPRTEENIKGISIILLEKIFLFLNLYWMWPGTGNLIFWEKLLTSMDFPIIQKNKNYIK